MKSGQDKVGRIRKTAEERREEILDAAVAEFAAHGLRGASVEDMAENVGVSQPYVYRLFGTKKDLFLAAAGHVRERVLETFGKGAGAEHADALQAMGQSYNLEFFRREEMMLMLQGFAASEDSEVKEAMASGFAEIWRFVQEVAWDQRRGDLELHGRRHDAHRGRRHRPHAPARKGGVAGEVHARRTLTDKFFVFNKLVTGY